jgi:hypothetical protein
MANPRRGLSRPTAFAVIAILVLAAAVVYLQSSSKEGNLGPSSSTSESASNGPRPGTTSTQHTPSSGGQTNATNIVGCLPVTFDEEKASGTMFNYSETQSYLRGAYAYSWAYDSRESCTSWLPPIITVNVTGFQSVAGNWSSQYVITYGNNTLLKAEVSRSYQVVNFTATRLPDWAQTLSFTPQQQQAIALALSDSAVKGYLAGIDYFAVSAYPPMPSGNQTVSDRYTLYFDQVNGGLVVGAFVNSGVTQVMGVFETHACRLFGPNGNIC